jgi:hypothetical protein
MGALVTVMVSPHLADGCAVPPRVAKMLLTAGWTAPGEAPDHDALNENNDTQELAGPAR